MIVFFLLGVFVAFLTSICGFGGGFLYVPIFLLVFGFPPEKATFLSLFGILATNLFSTLVYFRQRKVDIKLALLYDILDAPGVIFGVYLLKVLGKFSTKVIGAIIILLSILIHLKKRKGRIKNKILYYTAAMASSFLSGFVTGFAGMGGGVTDTITMILIGTDPKIAVGTSEFGMLPTTIYGILTKIFFTKFYIEAIPLFLGAMFGAILGASVSLRIRSKILKTVISIFGILVGIKIILS